MHVRSVRDIGRAVRQARTAHGLTQVQASGLVGRGTRFVGELEAGKPTVQMQLVLDYLAALGFDVHLLPRQPPA